MANQSSIERDIALISRSNAVPTILEVVARTTGMRFTAVARVTDTHWTACAVYDRIEFGLRPGGELVLKSTICNEIREHRQPIIFGHASKHTVFANHPTPKLYGFESYISIPIFLSDESFFGTLCAIDPAPAKIDDPELLKTLQLFAQLIAAQYEAERRSDAAESALLDAQSTARLRDQFVAVLGHDLRNPVQSISMGADMLDRDLPDGRERRIAKHIQRSCQRMSELISNIMDFALGKLGEGIAASMERPHDLASDLEHVVSEIQRAHPDREIVVTTSLQQAFACDQRRIGQLLGNLLSNAITHGSHTSPVRVFILSNASHFELAVENAGKPIAEDTIDRLFQPFTRGTSTSPKPGLGLGLYIAAEIAKAHGGTLQAISNTAFTRFVFRMRLDGDTNSLHQGKVEGTGA
ncbi:signal transduction histidine kinase [Rhodanobacter sp. ANJX3]|uniref:GAF domain-containing sensor histidine kinase n=1 Tax=unclassified Rhodanobacter TaxID=2621553 RepID=UPI0015CE0105|nr:MULTISPECIES: GAF domain-containing sensor histidine kinase [unclassified Rhodanobacter]MBB5358838.1 signal transduction histidine kinase [Rhodanobacter sp. ANJX3]NYE29238.1 signal transduction histidine kinase [Rhodanobacter sp. K2T2]